jgi:hypothetical protein
MLDDIFLQHAFCHLERAGIRIEAAFVPVVAVLAIEIAYGSRRLDEDLKIPGDLTQCSLQSLRCKNACIILHHRDTLDIPILQIPKQWHLRTLLVAGISGHCGQASLMGVGQKDRCIMPIKHNRRYPVEI